MVAKAARYNRQMSRRQMQRQSSTAMAAPCFLATTACGEQTKPPQSIPTWREISSVAACCFDKFEPSDMPAWSPTASSPASESSTSTSLEDSSVDCRLTSKISCDTSSTVASSADEGSSVDESCADDSGASDAEMTATETENLDAELLEAPRLVKALAQILAYRTTRGSATALRTSFHASRAPHVSIEVYLERIGEYFDCSAQCYALGLVYIDRVLKFRPDFVLNELSVHRLLLASLVVALKFHDDEQFSNAHYAKVGGVTLKSMNNLEKEFLQLIGWQVHVSAGEYDKYMKLLRLSLEETEDLGGID